MAEIVTNIDKRLMNQVAECFLNDVKTTSCMTADCNLTGLLNDTGSGDLNPEGLYPFSLADPVKLANNGWMVNDYVKGDSCEDIYKLLDDTVPVTDPETEIYASDGFSLSGRWLHIIKAAGWKPEHPTYPYWDNIALPDKFDNNVITDVIVYDPIPTMASTMASLFGTNADLPQVTLASTNTLSGVDNTYTSLGYVCYIFRLGLIEASTFGDVNSLYPVIASALAQISSGNRVIVMNTPYNAPDHLIEAYRQLSMDFDCIYLPSSVPMNANTNTVLISDQNLIELRITYWLINEILSKAKASTLTMFTPNSSTISVTEITKHLDIEMETP